MEKEKPQVFTNENGITRLDHFVSQHVPGCSKRSAKSLCERGFVRVEGREKSGGYLLQRGESVQVEHFFQTATRPEMVEKEGGKELVTVLWEDESVVVVSKPRKLHSVTLDSEDPVTLADWLSWHNSGCRTAAPDRREGGLIQRLDYYTSGVSVSAKNPATWKKLHEALLSKEIEKSYLVLSEGRLQEKNMLLSFSLCAKGAQTIITESAEIKGSFLAETQVNELWYDNDENVSVLRVWVHRARRHQIRAHLAHVGSPLIGDTQYGSKRKLSDIRLFTKESQNELNEGFLLHAETVTFTHPANKKTVTIKESSKYFQELMAVDDKE